jgi:hypothetical protein
MSNFISLAQAREISEHRRVEATPALYHLRADNWSGNSAFA